MVSVIPFVLIFGAIAVVVVVLFFHSQKASTLNQVYLQLARQYQGHLIPGGWNRRPAVRFVHGQAHVLVDTYSTGGKRPRYYTQLQISWPSPYLRMEIYPERLLSQLRKFFGMQDIQIGSPQFDRTYIIAGNDVTQIRRILNGLVQVSIERLRESSRHGDIYVRVQGGILLVKMLGLIRDFGSLEHFVRLCLHMYIEATQVGCEGIDFVDGSPSDPAAEIAVCQICGDKIDEQPVFCRGCRTPHHMDCWEYTGQCSTYGCGNTLFVRRNP